MPIAGKVMRVVASSLLFITLHDMDIAHTGAYSLYLEGIQRSDRPCAELWNMVQQNSEYKIKTTMFILMDFGKDVDGDAGDNGFQHHWTRGPQTRTTWMRAPGSNVVENRVIDRRVDSLDLVPTIAGLMGFDTPFAVGRRIGEIA